MKLKTLKDMNDGCTLKDCPVVTKDELRKEAIKWIKELERNTELMDKYDNSKRIDDNVAQFICRLPGYDWGDSDVVSSDELIEWIKYFFNITEEDLK